MTPSIARYTTLVFQPYPNRTEHVNYGIVAFLPHGGVRVHISSTLRKLRAIWPEVSIDFIRSQEAEIPKLVEGKPLNEAVGILNAIRVLRGVSEKDLGAFSYQNEDQYLREVRLALRSLCETPPGKGRERDSKSRLFLDVKSKFKLLGILATERGALPDHQVVENYVPDSEADVKVEFALQNGRLRVAQTLDLRADTRDSVSPINRNIAYSKTYALHYAKTALEQSGLESYVIVAGAHTDPAQKVISTIRHDVDHIVEWESNSDMDSFFSEWASAAGRPLPMIPIAR
ncbi:DUF3037 domain-containing protein [Burkholderia multivorans]|uniref:DUF3037 domain-containing protein n=1 Tax=Burkholderia multivorans TaxID=87883 RepID=UPI001C23C372|nr:DUF3037 domain-containing protein [Burkholderia multivorans]MBU9318921.1 DUF3037 domain-containing protein [Burkholderia multivorans]MDN8030030.1 DUF3037 domain-containing protein [Burkholderia multivorans]